MHTVTRGLTTQRRQYSTNPPTQYERWTCDYIQKGLEKFDNNGIHFFHIEEQFQVGKRRPDIIVFEHGKTLVVIDAKYYRVSRINDDQVKQLYDYQKDTKAAYTIMVVHDKKITRRVENLAKQWNIEILEFPMDSLESVCDDFINELHKILAKHPQTNIGKSEAMQVNRNPGGRSKIDGSLDMRLKENRKCLRGLKINGKPDMRFKANQKK